MLSITKNINGIEVPISISDEEILNYFLQYKGRLVHFIALSLVELKKDESDLMKLKLKELSKIIDV